MESLNRLNELYKDLVNFSESRLANVDRLWIELEESIQDLRGLLDKKSKSDTSRKQLESGKITIDDLDFQVNNEFKQIALEVADSLQLDELEAAKLVLRYQEETNGTAQNMVMVSAARFHERREVLLQDLRLVLKESLDVDTEDGIELRMQDAVANILDTKTGPPSNGSLYARKCLTALDGIEKTLVGLGEQTNKARVLGQQQADFLLEFIEVQKTSLMRQHEALGAILTYLFRGNYTISEDLRKLSDLARKRDRFDSLTIHYLPAIAAGIEQYGSADGSGNLRDARSLHKTLFGSPEGQQSHWTLPPLHAAVTLIWIAEYSSWYRDPGRASPLEGVDLTKEAEERSKLVARALDDGALECMLAVCGAVRPEERLDAARQEILTLLLNDTNGLALDGDVPTEYFTSILMESFEGFAEAWITNMPDDIRKLKVEEDEQRLHKLTDVQGAVSQNPLHDVLDDTRLHLEALFVLMSFAYEFRPDAADRFWGDPEGNLYGFLQWASRRQTVPRASAFCELLCALAQGDEPAASAHKFLLEESMTTTRARKMPSLNYGQIVAELQLYATKVNERSVTSRPMNEYRANQIPDLNELESPVMLSCYLRLITHMCIETVEARAFFLDTKDFSFVQTVLLLSSGPVPSYLRATVFKVLEALLTQKTSSINNDIWTLVDSWASGALLEKINPSKTTQHPQSPKATLHQTFEAIAVNFDQANAFASLLRALTAPPNDATGPANLPFPPDLGSTYRMPGIEPYVDFIVGHLFGKRAPELPDEVQIRSLYFNCLNFAAACLETFDEKLLIVSHSPSSRSVSSRQSSIVADYIHRHPCTRVMDWMYNNDVIKSVLQALHQEANVLDTASPFGLVVAVLQRSIDVVQLVLELQPSYLDILRPAAKRSPSQSPTVANSAIAAFEDTIVSHPTVLSDLAMYASTNHETLVLRSFSLIRIISNSRRLMSGRKSAGRSAFDLLKTSSFVRIASLSMLPKLQIDVRELEHGPSTPEYRFKLAILDFLNSCLSLSPNDRSVAHIFLGFTAVPGSYDLNLLDDEMVTVLHAIIGLADNYPDGEAESMLSWLIQIKSLAAEVLRRLWVCPPSSAVVRSELRAARYLPSQFAKQQLVNSQSLWDGRSILDPEIWLSDSANAINEFLRYRSFLYEYAITELRSVAHSRLPTLQLQTLSTLMGKSKFEEEQVEHPTVFDLFDFANLDFGADLLSPDLQYLADVNLEPCVSELQEGADQIFDLGAVEELLQLKVIELSMEGKVRLGQDDDHIVAEIGALLSFLKARNQRATAQASYSQALHMWSKLVIVTLESTPMSEEQKIQFHMQAFQVILPKLDSFLLNSPAQALDLATMVDTLTASLNVIEQTVDENRVGNLANDRLYQIFRMMLQGVHGPIAIPELREASYNICSRFLDRIQKPGPIYSKSRAHSLEAIKAAGTRLLTVMCDDADVGDGTCRLSALTALNSFVCLGKLEKSTYVVDTLVYFNFLEVLIDPIKSIASDLQQANAEEVISSTTLLQVRLSLLLQISQTKVGARYLLDSGLLPAIRGSLLFNADPDMGLDIDNPEALQKYYSLLASVLSLLASTFVHRGAHNEQIQNQMRQFLLDHRSHMTGMFKRYSGIGASESKHTSNELDDIIRSYTALLTMTSFVEIEEEQFQTRSKPLAFT
ncbi:putative nuclear pore complex subunit [Phaeomoniella chlamydospora]|uniref:Putative nuclear pore complex subunit n=1 Tax=Phaeomoniella chlamydospora TaxID=158046 RepID=A0A0G2GC29_PHACM|nr:putative nuclear pore complex subunit [Phaeomoniella chlamydospora]